MLRFSALLVLIGSLEGASAACRSALDCGLNGECLPSGACECDKGWRGAVCGELDLLPVDKAKRGLLLPGSATWGGTPIPHADGSGRISLFAEQMVNGCPLKDWVNNSQIVHATASSPLGPFAIQSLALPPFHHNVGAARVAGAGAGANAQQSDQWLIYSTGCNVWPDTLPNCTHATTPSATGTGTGAGAGAGAGAGRPAFPGNCSGLTPMPPQVPFQHLGLDGRIRLSTASSPDGPWRDEPLPVLQPQYGGWDPFTTNAAPLLLPNGSTVLVYRGINGTGTDAIGLAFSQAGPTGPFERISKDAPIFTDHSEDPFLYKGRRGYHIVMHHLPPNPLQPASFPFDPKVWACDYDCVGHAYAENLWGPWYYSPVPAANNTVAFTDGTTEVLNARERAQVLTDEHGDVLVLYNGVCCQPGYTDDDDHENHEITYTLAAPTAAYPSSTWGQRDAAKP